MSCRSAFNSRRGSAPQPEAVSIAACSVCMLRAARVTNAPPCKPGRFN